MNNSIFYKTIGTGSPLLCLHGWNSTSACFPDILISELSKKYKLIIPDLPGCGNSEMIDLSFENLCDIINSILEKLKISTISIMSYCMGGIISLDFAIRIPQKVDRFYVVETYTEFPYFLKPLLIPHFNKLLLQVALKSAFGHYLIKRLLCHKPALYNDQFFEAFKDVNIKNSIEYIKLLWRYSHINHFTRMSSIVAKTTIIIGENTKTYVKIASAKLSSSISNSTIVTIPNSGHFLMEENPKMLSDIILK